MSSSSWIGQLNVDQFVQAKSLQEKTEVDKGFTAQLSQLNQIQTGVNTQLSIYSQLASVLNSFQSTMTQLKNSFTASYQVTSSNNNAVMAQIANSNSIAVGTHTLSVSKLAQASSIASQQYSSTTTALNMTNTLTLQVGSNTSFTVNVGPTDTLQSIAANINQTNNGVSASIVTTGAGSYRLVLSSTQTGAANALTLSESGTGSNALNISTGTGGTGTVLTNAQDASFTFDNLAFSSATNNNISVLGMNLNLINTVSVSSPVTLTIGQTNSTSNVTTAAQNMVASYNQLLTYIEQTEATVNAQSTDPSLPPALPPDSTLPSVMSALQNVMGAGSSAYQLLNSIGITIQPSTNQTVTIQSTNKQINFKVTGLLGINTDSSNGLPTLSSALASSFNTVQSVFNDSSAGIATNTINLINQPGAIWKALYDPLVGSIPKDNAALTNVQNQITKVSSDQAAAEQAIINKYASLEVNLLQLQNTSIYLSQMVDMMTKP